eukprot:5286828-Prymnesium_polylepis.1
MKRVSAPCACALRARRWGASIRAYHFVDSAGSVCESAGLVCESLPCLDDWRAELVNRRIVAQHGVQCWRTCWRTC